MQPIISATSKSNDTNVIVVLFTHKVAADCTVHCVVSFTPTNEGDVPSWLITMCTHTQGAYEIHSGIVPRSDSDKIVTLLQLGFVDFYNEAETQEIEDMPRHDAEYAADVMSCLKGWQN